MTSSLAQMHEFHFHHDSAHPSASQRREIAKDDAETRSGTWMTTSIIAAVAAFGVGAAAFGYMRAPALATGPATQPITRSWAPDPSLALVAAHRAAARVETPAVAEPTVAATPAPVAMTPAVTESSDSDNPY